jgi:signal transduction histidine kinase
MLIVFAIFSGALIYTIDSKLKQDLNGKVTVERVDGTMVDVDEIVEVLVLYIDGILILIITFLSYFLAGKTLKPIEDNFNKQKRFFADVSHDLRTPISIIAVESEVALQDSGSNEASLRKTIQSNLEEARRMSKLLNDLLLVQRGGNKNITDKFVLVDLHNFIKKMMQKMRMPAQNKGLKLAMSEYKKIIVKININDFERAILNILQNAINYTHSGSIKSSLVDDAKKAYITISDTGVGISEQNLPFVFDRFYKAEHSRHDESGSGLGLSISKQIIEQHRGSISIESKVNAGTAITITIPKK